MHTRMEYGHFLPSSLHPNPLRVARQDAGLTQQELAVKAQVTRHTVLRAEQGLYIQPPTALVRALGLHLMPLLSEWESWVRNERALHSHRFQRAVAEHETFGGFTHQEFRKRVSHSKAGYAKILVYPIGLITKYEEDGTCKDSLQKALVECGVHISLDEFEDYSD